MGHSNNMWHCRGGHCFLGNWKWKILFDSKIKLPKLPSLSISFFWSSKQIKLEISYQKGKKCATQGEGVRKEPKKCHVIFERPFTVKKWFISGTTLLNCSISSLRRLAPSRTEVTSSGRRSRNSRRAQGRVREYLCLKNTQLLQS